MKLRFFFVVPFVGLVAACGGEVSSAPEPTQQEEVWPETVEELTAWPYFGVPGRPPGGAAFITTEWQRPDRFGCSQSVVIRHHPDPQYDDIRYGDVLATSCRSAGARIRVTDHETEALLAGDCENGFTMKAGTLLATIRFPSPEACAAYAALRSDEDLRGKSVFTTLRVLSFATPAVFDFVEASTAGFARLEVIDLP